MTGRMPTLMLRSLPRTSMRNARVNVQVRNVATRATPEASGSSSTRWNLAGAAAGLVGAGAAAYAIQSQGKPLQLEGRKLWSDRMKPRGSKGDASLHQDAQLRHVEPDAEPVADETPGTIEVAVEEVEGEAGQQQSAYNPDTGEINWDCPCLGGMADGPCGEQFKAAFSCFIYSEAEPKGIDCVDKFKTMQNCFREHPEIYKEEIEDDEAANESFEAEEQAVSAQNIEQ